MFTACYICISDWIYDTADLICNSPHDPLSNDINGGLKIRHLGVNPSASASIFICLRLNIFVIFYKAVYVVHSKFYSELPVFSTKGKCFLHQCTILDCRNLIAWKVFMKSSIIAGVTLWFIMLSTICYSNLSLTYKEPPHLQR
jgi:hypothetical protein